MRCRCWAVAAVAVVLTSILARVVVLAADSSSPLHSRIVVVVPPNRIVVAVPLSKVVVVQPRRVAVTSMTLTMIFLFKSELRLL